MKTKRHAHVVSVGIVFLFLFSFLPRLDLGSDGSRPRTVSLGSSHKAKDLKALEQHCTSFAVFFASFAFSSSSANVSECVLFLRDRCDRERDKFGHAGARTADVFLPRRGGGAFFLFVVFT